MRKIIVIFLLIWASTCISIAQNSFQDFLIRKLDEGKFTPSADKLAREAALRFIRLYNSGSFFKVYSSDNISHTYTIDTGKLPDELNYLFLAGSNCGVSSDLFEKINSSPESCDKNRDHSIERKFNSLIASYIKEFLSSYNPSDDPSSPYYISHEKRTIRNDFMQWIIESYYGGNKDAFVSDWSTIKSDYERKKRIMQFARDAINSYLDDYNKNRNMNFPDTDKAFSVRDALNTNDWDLFKTAAFKLGWNPLSLLNF